MTNKRKAPPPMPFFAVSEQTNEPRAKREKKVQNDAENHNRSVSEARENGFMDVIIDDSQDFAEASALPRQSRRAAEHRRV